MIPRSPHGYFASYGNERDCPWYKPLVAVPDHADQIEPYVAEFLDERVVREPAVHQDIVRVDACLQDPPDHEKRSFRLLKHAARP